MSSEKVARLLTRLRSTRPAEGSQSRCSVRPHSAFQYETAAQATGSAGAARR